MHRNVGNSTKKRTNINKCYIANMNFVIFCTNLTSGEVLMPFQYSTCFAFYGT